jgi:hypothetical protein
MVPLVLILLVSLVALPAGTGAQGTQPQPADSPDSLPALIFPLLSYQGRLVESGAPVTGSRSMTFRLWTTPALGVKVWEEGPKTVLVTNGLFTATLGDTTVLPMNWFQYELWLEVQVDAATLPRQRLMGAPYALSLAPGAQVLGSKAATDPAVVTVENASAGVALEGISGNGTGVRGSSKGSYGVYAQSGTGTALYAANESNLPALQVANTAATGPAAQLDSTGTPYVAMLTNSYAGVGNQGGVLRLVTNGGRVILAQNKSFAQLFSVEANGDVTQSRTAGGLVKTAISAICGDSGSTIQRYFTQGRIPTIADGATAGACTIDPGFDPAERYWTVTPTGASDMRLAMCKVTSSQFTCMRTNTSGAGVNGTIQVLIY